MTKNCLDKHFTSRVWLGAVSSSLPRGSRQRQEFNQRQRIVWQTKFESELRRMRRTYVLQFTSMYTIAKDRTRDLVRTSVVLKLDTQFWKMICPSFDPSVYPAVRPSAGPAWLENCENARFRAFRPLPLDRKDLVIPVESSQPRSLLFFKTHSRAWTFICVRQNAHGNQCFKK